MEPFCLSLCSSSGAGPQRENCEWIVALPRVFFMSTPWMPMRPRVLTSKVWITRPSNAPASVRSWMPPRDCISEITTPWLLIGTSTTASSMGSVMSPVSGSLRRITSGAPTMSSKPSRRMFSIRIPSCKVPRPLTLKLSEELPASTLTAMLLSASRSRRFFSMVPVSFVEFLHFPARGEVLTPNSITTVGSSTMIGGSGLGHLGSTTVSPMWTSSTPAKAQMSPARTSSTSTRSLFEYSQSFETFAVRSAPSSPCWKPTSCPTLRLPARSLPTQIRPT
mmetsp:Transcript_25666/g.56589  ORF Transcript_25666/g.56589 Transcript_25666/m.56589 type:complete len:278 (-) Transcript_25666:1036-1869(-)